MLAETQWLRWWERDVRMPLHVNSVALQLLLPPCFSWSSRCLFHQCSCCTGTWETSPCNHFLSWLHSMFSLLGHCTLNQCCSSIRRLLFNYVYHVLSIWRVFLVSSDHGREKLGAMFEYRYFHRGFWVPFNAAMESWELFVVAGHGKWESLAVCICLLGLFFILLSFWLA